MQVDVLLVSRSQANPNFFFHTAVFFFLFSLFTFAEQVYQSLGTGWGSIFSAPGAWDATY